MLFKFFWTFSVVMPWYACTVFFEEGVQSNVLPSYRAELMHLHQLVPLAALAAQSCHSNRPCDNLLSMAEQKEDKDDLPFTFLDGLMRLVNFHLGGSLYAMPKVALEGGWTSLVLLLGCCAVLTQLVYENIADVALQVRKGSLGGMVSAVLGRKCAILLRLLVVLNAFGTFIAYLKAATDIYSGVMQESASGGMQLCFLGAVAICLGLVLALQHLHGRVDWGSLMANGTLLILLGALFFVAPSSKRMPPPQSLRWMTVSHGPSLVFAFSSAEYVLLACAVSDEEGNLHSKSQIHRRVRLIGATSLLLSFSLYMLVGYGGIRAFGPATHGDILLNFSLGSSYELLSAVLLGTNAASLLLSLPVFAEALLQNLQHLLTDILPSQYEYALRTYVDPTLGCHY